jgi:hypothetical protein
MRGRRVHGASAATFPDSQLGSEIEKDRQTVRKFEKRKAKEKLKADMRQAAVQARTATQKMNAS